MSQTQEIFKLRKEGRLDEALTLAESAFARFYTDPWVIRAYGWVLYDKLKAALAGDLEEEIFLYSGKLGQLEIPEEDEILKSHVTFLLSRSGVSERMFSKANGLDFNGEHENALVLYRQLKENFGDDAVRYHNAYGWCLYKYLKTLITNQAGGREVWKELLEEYFGLHAEKPSQLHSLMLFLSLHHFKDDREFMLKWAGQFVWGNFRPEDFSSYEKEGKEFPGLAERSVQALAKTMFSSGDRQKIEEMQSTLDQALQKYTSNIWLYYYKAKMLVSLGLAGEARKFVIPVVRQKKGDFWTWALLGDLLSEEDKDTAISCYCNAVTCKSEEKFLINTRWSFGKILHDAGFNAEARHEFELSLKTRQEQGYGILADKTRMLEEEWYRNTEAKSDNKGFYRERSGKAVDYVFGSLPGFRGNLIRTFIRPDDPGKSLRARMVLEGEGGDLLFTSVRVGNYPALAHLLPGDGVFVTAETGEKLRIMKVETRDATEPFDVLDWETAVVDHVNRDKNMTHVSWTRDSGAILRGIPYGEGDFIRLKVVTRKEEGKGAVNEILIHESTDLVPSKELVMFFSERLRVIKGKGFALAGNIFVSPDMVQRSGLISKDGNLVQGVAVASQNPRDGKWGWKALKIEH